MRGVFRITAGRLTFVTVLLAVLTAPLQPLADFGVVAQELACSVAAAASEGLSSFM